MNRYGLSALSVSGGILSGLAWCSWCSGLILLTAFVPFLIIEDHIYRNRNRFSGDAVFLYLLPGFLIFALIAVGWLRAVSIAAAVIVTICAAMMMSFVWWAAHRVKIMAGPFAGYLSLTAFWLLFEFLCLNAAILSPWLNLGNGLAKDVAFIQWYEYTGTAGGTLWIIISNLFLWFLLKGLTGKNPRAGLALPAWLLITAIPSAVSLLIFSHLKSDNSTGYEVVAVQPNYDPYLEKYSIPFDVQLERSVNLAESAATASTAWIILPETAVDDPVNEKRINGNNYISMLESLNGKYPRAEIIAGIVTYITDAPEESYAGEPGREERNRSGETRFNSALNIAPGRKIEIYHKSKLVPGFENVPASGLFRFVSRILPVPGDGSWNYGSQKDRAVFTGSGRYPLTAPVICYESVFGEFVTDYIKLGAEVLFIITNDGWWKNTNGYRQHLSYASLRAIETRRPVVRCANTGISCLINIRGQVTEQTEWWKSTVLKGMIYPQRRMTTYVKHGDVILRSAVLISFLILLRVFLIAPLLKKIKPSVPDAS